MSKILQVFYFICYGLAALAVAVMVPKIFPETPRSVAWLAGLVVFLSGALMHEIASRCYQASLDRHRLAILHRAYVDAMEDIDRLAVEVRAVKRMAAYYPEAETQVESETEMLAEAAPTPAADHLGAAELASPAALVPEDNSDTTTAEAKLLRSLVHRLYASPNAAHGSEDRSRAAGMESGGNTAVVSGSLIERETLNAVRDALRESHLDLYLQPVVTLPQRKPHHFDCSVRLNSERGDFMPPALYNEILHANDLMRPVDNMLLFRTIELVGKSRSFEPGGYGFCRIPPSCLSDRAFFHDFLDYLRDADDLISRVAFEFREVDVIELDDAGADALGALVELGFHLCVSQLQNLDVDAGQLVEGGVRFVKIDAEMLTPAMTDEAEAARVRRLKSGLDEVRIDLIVADVANEQLLVELLDFDIEFGQGPLFGDPRKSSQVSAVAAEGRQGRG